MSPLCETFLTAEQLEADGAVLPAPRARLRALLARPAPEFVPPEEIFSEYAYFSAYSDSWVEHARRYVEMMRERLGLGPDEPRRRARVERRLPAPALRRRRASRSSGSSRRANVAEAADARGVPTLVEFFGRELGRAARRGARTRATSSSATTSSPRCPTSTTSSRGVASCSRPTARRRSSSRTSLRLLEGLAVRHDLPRALLVLLARTRSARSSARTGSTSSTSRSCRRHGGSLRVYAPARRTGRDARRAAVDELLAREDAAGLRAIRSATRGSREDVQRVEAGAARPPDRPAARGQAGRRLRRARERATRS